MLPAWKPGLDNAVPVPEVNERLVFCKPGVRLWGTEND